MKLLTGLFRFARKRVQTTDNDMGMFREKINELVEKKAELLDEEVEKRVDELKGMTTDLPDEEEKAKLDRFLEDFKSVKEQDDATAKEAASMVADLFEKLDTAAMKDVPKVDGEEAVEKAEEVTEETPEETTETASEETVAPEGKKEETKDDDPNPAYTLEEIYQFCKKRRAEEEAEATDGCSKDSVEKVVTDSAPRIPVTMNGMAASGEGLNALFNIISKGGR